jgi:vacuolar-type H+-ATPase subunit B/Vma2
MNPDHTRTIVPVARRLRPWHTLIMQERSSSTRDPNSLAAQIFRLATEQPDKDPLAVVLGQRGGLKGGAARAARLSPRKRRAIAKKAARARWANQSG